MSHQRTLFLRTYEDLAQRVQSSDWYEALRASALIRALLLDSHPLVDQVNKTYRLKLSFPVALPPPFPPSVPKPVFWILADGLDPLAQAPGTQVQTLKRDQFLQLEVLRIQGRGFSIREIVLYEANVMGGVHPGVARTSEEEALKLLDSWLELGGDRPCLQQLRSIGRVVLHGLKPLYDAAQTDDSPAAS